VNKAAKPIDGLRVIALFKFGKALLLALSVYGLRKLANPELIARLSVWTSTLTDGFTRHILTHALDWLGSVAPARINTVIAVAMAYLALVMAEGTGLWLRKAWAEWLTVVATASLIPFELWELFFKEGGHKAGALLALAINLVILGYLIAILRRNGGRRIRFR